MPDEVHQRPSNKTLHYSFLHSRENGESSTACSIYTRLKMNTVLRTIERDPLTLAVFFFGLICCSASIT
jgi:hypothetical protein